MKPRPDRLTIPLILTLLALAACGAKTSDPGSTTPAAAITVGTVLAADQVLSRTIDSAPPALDPSLCTDVPSQIIMDDLFEGLTVIGMTGKIEPGVASSWDITPDGLTWTFHLRPTAKWSNGEPLTAKDFVYGWRRVVDPKTRAEYAQSLAPIRNGLEIATGKLPIEQLGVEAVDAHTLVVHLAAPTPYFTHLLTNMYLYPLHEATINKWGDDWTRPEHIVSNGPFRVVENIIGNKVTLERNPEYWDVANVKITRVIYYAVDDRTAQRDRFLAGQVQFIETFPTTDAAWLKRTLGDQFVVAPYYGTFQVGLNQTKPPFKGNRALRMALNLAFDRDMITDHVLNGAGFPAYTLVPPLDGYEAQIPAWAKLGNQQRYDLARKYYKEAGYSDKHPLKAEMAFSSGDPVTRLTYEAIAAMWREQLGAEISLHEEEFKVLLQDRRLHIPQLFHDAWIGDFLDPFTFQQLYNTGFELNNSGYTNPAFDTLLHEATTDPDNARRYQLFEQGERMLDDDAASVPVYYYSVRHLVKPYLKGWQANIVDRNYSRYMYLLEHEGS